MSGEPRGKDDSGVAAINRIGWSEVLRRVEDYATERGLRGPLDEPALRRHAQALLDRHPDLHDAPTAVALMLHNTVSIERMQAVAPERRLLLLPRCLSNRTACRGTPDAAGLLCARCMHCDIATLVNEAEALGYVTLVTEGATLVRQLIASGRIDAVLGVGCLESLEKLFPDLLAYDVPGLAVPLRCAGCEATEVDVAWVRHLLQQTASGPRTLSLETTVRRWFDADALRAFWLDPARCGDVEQRAFEALTAGGNRWRPYLAVAVFAAIRDGLPEAGPQHDALRTLALSVECFHKASLVHDDLEDGDDERYGQPTLHCRHGAAIAINVGDFLIGEGYRLLALATGTVDAPLRMAMQGVAIEGHRRLCLGQGEELAWTRRPRPLAVQDALTVLTDKTAPAFEVALLLGTLMAEGPDALCEALSRFSRTFGRAFQMRDDLQDFEQGTDRPCLRPNLVLALLCERATGPDRQMLEARLASDESPANAPYEPHRLREAAARSGALDETRRLLAWELRALREQLDALPSPAVAQWLRHVVARVFGPAF